MSPSIPIPDSPSQRQTNIIHSHFLSHSLSRSAVPTERTPLLSFAPSSFPNGTAGLIVQQAFAINASTNGETLVIEEAGSGQEPVITQPPIGTLGFASEVMPVVHAQPLSSSSSSSSSLSSMCSDDDFGRDNALAKIADEETPLLFKKPMGGVAGVDEEGKTRFLMGISEKQFWFIFTGILVVNFVSLYPHHSSCLFRGDRIH